MIDHLKESHGLALNPKSDFCGPCKHIFCDRLEAMDHMMNCHILCYEDFEVASEQPPNSSVTVWLKDIFERLKDIRKDLMTKILFAEYFPPSQDITVNLSAYHDEISQKL